MRPDRLTTDPSFLCEVTPWSDDISDMHTIARFLYTVWLAYCIYLRHPIYYLLSNLILPFSDTHSVKSVKSIFPFLLEEDLTTETGDSRILPGAYR